MILLAGSAAHANRSYHLAVLLQRDAAREYHNLSVVRRVNAEELTTRLGMSCEVFCLNVESARRVGFLLGNIDTADPCRRPYGTWETRFPPSSATAMFIGWPISAAFFSAAAIIRRASLSVTWLIGALLDAVMSTASGDILTTSFAPRGAISIWEGETAPRALPPWCQAYYGKGSRTAAHLHS